MARVAGPGVGFLDVGVYDGRDGGVGEAEDGGLQRAAEGGDDEEGGGVREGGAEGAGLGFAQGGEFGVVVGEVGCFAGDDVVFALGRGQLGCSGGIGGFQGRVLLLGVRETDLCVPYAVDD